MSMGGSTPAAPTPKPEIPVPQEDDPRGVDAARKSMIAIGKRKDGSATGHLLAGPTGLTSDPQVTTKSLMPTY